MKVWAFRRWAASVAVAILDAEERAASECAQRHGDASAARRFVGSFYGRHHEIVAKHLGCSDEDARAYCRDQRETVTARGWDAACSEGRDRLARLAWAGLGGVEMDNGREVYAMVPEVLAQWSARAAGADPVEAMREHSAAAISPQRRASGAVAVIPVHGMITQRPTLFTALFGGTSTVALADAVEAAVADPAVCSVVLDVDSPGGTVMGCTEAAARIRAARGSKPILAVANSQASSAAYWLASSADAVYVTPSGLTGSVGVITQHADYSAALEREGIKITTITYGKHKADGHDSAPLTEESLSAIQADVDYYGRQFEADVAKGRGVRVQKVARDFGQGAQLTAEAALSAGVVDGIATIDEVIAKAARGWKPAAPRAEEPEPAIVAEAPAVVEPPVPVCDAALWAVKWGVKLD